MNIANTHFPFEREEEAQSISTSFVSLQGWGQRSSVCHGAASPSSHHCTVARRWVVQCLLHHHQELLSFHKERALPWRHTGIWETALLGCFVHFRYQLSCQMQAGDEPLTRVQERQPCESRMSEKWWDCLLCVMSCLSRFCIFTFVLHRTYGKKKKKSYQNFESTWASWTFYRMNLWQPKSNCQPESKLWVASLVQMGMLVPVYGNGSPLPVSGGHGVSKMESILTVWLFPPQSPGRCAARV